MPFERWRPKSDWRGLPIHWQDDPQFHRWVLEQHEDRIADLESQSTLTPAGSRSWREMLGLGLAGALGAAGPSDIVAWLLSLLRGAP